jgi:hypothetical protein
MRTKTLILTVALSAAGIATSMAQVYSVNAVGYVNQTVPSGYSMVANPFITATNTLDALLPATQVPALLTLFKYGPGGYTVATADDLAGEWISNGTNIGPFLTIDFGDGVFLLNPSAPFTVTWVGEVAQNPAPATPVMNPLVTGYQIKSSKIPQAGKITTDLGYPPLDFDTLFKFNTMTQGYEVHTYDELEAKWFRNGVENEPLVGIAESVFLLRSAGGSWNRNFTVN